MRTTQAQLLAVALEHFSKTSFDRTRIADITRELGLSQAALYMHFPSKQALFDRVIEEYCLPQEVAGASTEEGLAKLLGCGPAADVLRIVLREWPNVPGVTLRYQEALIRRLAAAPDGPSAPAAVYSGVARAAATILLRP